MKLLRSFRLAIILSLIALFVTEVYAQNESGTRDISAYEAMLKVRKKWYDTSTMMYQHQFPIIRSIPPLSTTMPYNVLLSYIYADSLLRFAPRATLKNRISAWTSLNDTLKWMAYGDYVMCDYNPIIFRQYKQETVNWQQANASVRSTNAGDTLPVITGKYKSSYNVIKPLMDTKIAQALPDQSASKAIMSLLTCDYILKIKILSIDSMPDKLSAESFPGAYYYRVTASVLDTIKGKVLPLAPAESRRTNNEKPLGASSVPIIQFGYTSRAYHSLDVVGSNGIYRYSEPDSAFLTGEGIEFSMKKDQEAVVFLSYFNTLIDYQHDYFDLSLDPLASLNALPVIEGDVRDINKVWSANLLSSYASWKSSINALITKILSRNY